MSCRRCSLCGINYPYSKTTCEVCAGKLDGIGNDEPDQDWQESVRLAKSAGADPPSSSERILAWRLLQFIRLGFQLEQAEALARSRVDHHRVRRMIEAGCPPEVALQIVV